MKYTIFALIMLQSSLMCGQNGSDGSSTKNQIGSVPSDSVIAPRFIHRRFKGDLAGKPAFLEFTIAFSDKSLPSGYWMSTYLNYRDSLFGTDFLTLETSQREQKYDNNRDRKVIRMNRNDESEQIRFRIDKYSGIRDYRLDGFLDKKHGTYTGKVSNTRDVKVMEYPLEFREDGLLSADYASLPRLERALKNANYHAIDNYDIFQFTYYDPKILSGIFAFRDTTPELERESQGCSNYAYSMSMVNDQIIDIDRIFKPGFRDKLGSFFDEHFEDIVFEKVQNGRFFVCKGGLVFVHIGGRQCYDEEYQGKRNFVPFSILRPLGIIDEAYCKSMGIDLGY